jgi:hypothetical protein
MAQAINSVGANAKPKKMPYNAIEDQSKPEPMTLLTHVYPHFPLADRLMLKMCGCVYKQQSFS